MNFGDLGRVLTDSLPGFVRNYLFQSAVVMGLVVALLLPAWKQDSRYPDVLRDGPSTFAAVALFLLATVVLAMVSGFATIPVYRVLEGYSLPSWLRSWLLRRKVREWKTLRAVVAGGPGITAWGKAMARLQQFPSHEHLLMPTRLGNAMRAMETYGADRFGLDSVLFWNEILAAAPDRIAAEVEEARRSVDFYVNCMVQLVLLALTSLITAAETNATVGPLIIAAASFLLVPLALSSAVDNIQGWRSALQAAVNTGRTGLAESLGLRLPETFALEHQMWISLAHVVTDGDRQEWLDIYRASRVVPTRPDHE